MQLPVRPMATHTLLNLEAKWTERFLQRWTVMSFVRFVLLVFVIVLCGCATDDSTEEILEGDRADSTNKECFIGNDWSNCGVFGETLTECRSGTKTETQCPDEGRCYLSGEATRRRATCLRCTQPGDLWITCDNGFGGKIVECDGGELVETKCDGFDTCVPGDGTAECVED